MTLPLWLEVVAHAVTAMLATWLGLTVTLRAGRRPGARSFAVLTLLLVAWSVSILVRRLTGDPAVDEPARWLEVAGASLLPPAVLTVATALTVERRPPRWMSLTLIGFWLLSIGVTLLTIVRPELEPRIVPPHLSLPGLPGDVIGWGWIGLRVTIFAASLAWIVLVLRDAGPDRARRQQLQATALALLAGTMGGVARITPPWSDSDPWVGVALVTLSLVIATYAVFARGIFMASETADRAFRYSAVVGLLVAVYVVVLAILDSLARSALDIDAPIVIGLALVATVALLEPIVNRVRRWVPGADEGDEAYARLLRALGEGVITAQRPEDSIKPALDQVTRALALSGAVARDADDTIIATSGDPVEAAGLAIDLERGGISRGTVTYGRKASGLPFTSREREVLEQASVYLGASLELSARQEAQARELERLAGERSALTRRGRALHGALTEALPGADRGELHVYALGALRAERDGEAIRQWGGQKAGTRQAEALFAFLFDRGDRGVAKDEAIGLIWPDVDLDRADLAFHRTLGGLRRALEPGRGRRQGSVAIGFSNDRYRLDPGLVTWDDVSTFQERLGAASDAGAPADALRALTEARGLYRGDYLDDCPFYGDSAEVEDRRQLLQGRFVDLLLALGAAHEARGDRSAAAGAFREARLAALDDCPLADAGLARLGAT